MTKSLVDEIKKRLVYEFEHHKSGGVYATLQTMMAYNSNRIEGSTLTERQTYSIFETGSVFQEEDIAFRTKDVEEMTGHFRMFNNVLKILDNPLSEEMIKTMHYDLKVGVFEDVANGYPCGEYKSRPNRVGHITTALPEEIPEKMSKLLYEYNSKESISLADLAKFHADYENIHPFQDGNGRTGRMILFKECLKNDILPIVIHDEHKSEYYKCLNAAQTNGDYNKLETFLKKEQSLTLEKIKDLIAERNVSQQLASDQTIREMINEYDFGKAGAENTLVIASGIPGSGKTDACKEKFKELTSDKDELDVTKLMPVSVLSANDIYTMDKSEIKKKFEYSLKDTSGVVMVSVNDVREEIKTLGSSDDVLTFVIIDARIEAALKCGLDVVYDATNLDSQIRDKYLLMADKYGAKSEILLCEVSIDKAKQAHPEIREDILENMQERFYFANKDLSGWDKVIKAGKKEIIHDAEYTLER